MTLGNNINTIHKNLLVNVIYSITSNKITKTYFKLINNNIRRPVLNQTYVNVTVNINKVITHTNV